MATLKARYGAVDEDDIVEICEWQRLHDESESAIDQRFRAHARAKGYRWPRNVE
jgi:hypothetical protein